MTIEIIKQCKDCVVYANGHIIVKNVRASYPNLASQGEFQGKSTGFSVTVLLPKSTHGLAKKLIDERIAVLQADAKLGRLAPDRICLRDGDLTVKDENAGAWTLAASQKDNSKRKAERPASLDRRGQRIDDLDAIERLFYGGCWVNMKFGLWAQNSTEYGKRINANLVAVQFVKDDEPFGSGRISDDVVDEGFEDIGDSDDDNI